MIKVRIGSFGRMQTFSKGIRSTSRLVLVVGYCPPLENLYKIDLLLKPDKWTNVQEIAKVPRYVALTPKLTALGYLSTNNQKIGMAPTVKHLEGYWEEMCVSDWIAKMKKLNKENNVSLPIADTESWIHSFDKAIEMNRNLFFVN
jgi:hypothetical protein